ncbi:MAG: topoisomerase IV [Oscillospiraceae bacterium]|nr:topoisomerase IV [Oscillospiraceae bacterium]
MAKRKQETTKATPATNINAEIAGAGEILVQPITETMTENFMPYAMSVIISRAIPEIDGFKPSHRKLLYTMYKMGLLSGARTKSANIVGQTMRLNPHGDAAIYDTMVRLSRGNESLLHPFVDSKGNFGKAYSRDMSCAAPRYTEAKLAPICAELFSDIDKDTVDFVDNYDNSMKEPTLLPATFPTVMVNANIGIAVGMASSICPFNLAEVCRTTVELIRNPDHDISSTLQAPDFPGGGQILYNAAELEKIYTTGRGNIRIRSKYRYDKSENCIDILEIPASTTIESIMDKITELVKAGKIKEISYFRDEIGIDGFRLSLDLKRGTDPDKLMQKLFKLTPLEDSYSCNFNVLIAGSPQVMGVRDLLNEWIAFRTECVKRRIFFDMTKKKEKLHLLKGLQKILLDIDKAIRIVRETDEEAEVVPNLMIGFGIDRIQAEYVAEIRLRHLNREYILKRTEETDQLEKDIAEMEQILASRKKVQGIIIKELEEVAKKYGQPRKSEIIYEAPQDSEPEEEEIPDYPVHLFFTKEGYFKKITPLSLRMGGEQKLKEGDAISAALEGANNWELLFFTDRCQVYKSRANDFEDTKASVLGDYVPAALGMEDGERVVGFAALKEYKGFMLFVYENGKVAKVEMEAYETKTRRKKLIAAFSDKSPIAQILYLQEDCEVLLTSSAGRLLLVHTGALAPKQTKNTQGVNCMTLKKGIRVVSAEIADVKRFASPARYRTKTLPAAGMLPSAADSGEQLTM